MGIRINGLEEAERQDSIALALEALAHDSPWWIMQWWYRRGAAQHRESADIWRGLAWRHDRAMERQMEKVKAAQA